MNRTTVALLAALEAVIVAAVGIGIVLVPLTILWAAQFHLAVDWGIFWRAAADTWLVGHGVDLTVSLDPVTAATLALPGAATPFRITGAALGLGLLTVVLGVRTGMRAIDSPARRTGVVASVLAFAAVSALVTLSAMSAVVQPSVWQGIVLPTAVFALGVAVGAGLATARAQRSAAIDVAGPARTPRPPRLFAVVRDSIDRLPAPVRSGAATALRAGTMAAALVIGLSAVILSVLVIVDFGTVVGLYERLQAGALGGAALTIAQMAFVPNLVIWLASWLVGPGFALGTGSSVSPVGTELGPIPTVPLFGLLPQGDLAFGFLGLLVPVVAGFVAAVAMRGSIASRTALHGGGWRVATALAIGVVGGLELGLLAWWSAGAFGPGRLNDVGPNPLLVAGIGAAEFAIAAAIGMVSLGRSKL